MGQIITNVASLGLLVLLFTAIARRAPDDRLRCWLAGWGWILIHTILKLWTPTSTVSRLVNLCASVDALGLSAVFFLVSTMIVREGRTAGLRLGSVLTLFTLPCLTVAIIEPHLGRLLATLVIIRQCVAVGLAIRTRINPGLMRRVTIPTCAASLALMLFGLAHGHSEYVVLTLLGEMYFTAGLDFWSRAMTTPSLV